MKYPEEALSKVLKDIYHLFGFGEEVTVSQVMKELNLPRSTASRRLSLLVKEDLVTQIGKGRAARYKIRRSEYPGEIPRAMPWVFEEGLGCRSSGGLFAFIR